jgi:hypothetical protein
MRLSASILQCLILISTWSGWILPAAAQTTERASISSSGGESSAGGIQICTSNCTMIYFHNQWPSISSDGRFVAFYSLAGNLVSGDDNNYTDIFLHDRQSGATSILSRNGTSANGNSSLPYINQSGQNISFRSEASNLVSSDTNGKGDIFVFSMATGQLELASIDSNGWLANGDSYNSVLTPDGRYVAFDSIASNLTTNDTNNTYDIFLRDRLAGTTERITVNSSGVEANGPSFDPVISSDGRFIAFHSFASNLVSNDNNNASDIFVYDRQMKTFELVSTSDQGTIGNSDSVMPSMSDDGSMISFRSLASNLVANDNNNTFDIFVRNLTSKKTLRVNVTTNGDQANGPSIFNSISNDGTRVVFDSYANNLVLSDTNISSDIFMHNLSTGETERISVSDSGAEANQSSSLPIISGDGRYVAFESFASNMVSNDNNGNKDIFVTDLGPRNHAPVANAGADSVYECSGPSTQVTLDGSLSSDLDNDPLQYVWNGFFGERNGVTTSFYMGPGQERIDLTVDDGQGATDSDSVYVSVSDSIAPSITMPNNIELEAESAAGTSYQVEPSYQEQCGTSSVNITPSLSTYPLGETIVDIEITDVGNNVSHHSMSVNVIDTTPPSVTAPADITTEATAPLTAIDIGQAQAWDAVGVQQLTNDGPGGYPVGDTIVTWSAIDAAGNKTTATQKVSVTDTTPPVLTIPGDIVAEANSILSQITLGSASAMDLVDGSVQVHNDMPAAGFPLGNTIVTWTATDSHGNSATARQLVTVHDTTAPLLVAPADISITADGPMTTVDIGTADVNDIFGATASNDAPQQFPLGTTLVTWTATDGNGNTSTAVQTINVHYAFDGYLPPLKAGKLYRGERTIPVKISLSYANGNFAADARIEFALYKLDATGQKTAIELDDNHTNSDGIFRVRGNHYLFLLKTELLESGTYLIEATPDDNAGGHFISIRYQHNGAKADRAHKRGLKDG